MTPLHLVVGGVLVRGDRVLLCHRHPARRWYPDVWDLPGGHLHPGEDPVAALVRELGWFTVARASALPLAHPSYPGLLAAALT